jgi:O-antigen/teichoic acid export membrane protein
VLIEGTRLSLAAIVPTAITLAVFADVLIGAWVGQRFAGSVMIVRLLAVVVTIQIATSTVQVVLNGIGLHRLEAGTSVSASLCNLVLSVLFVKQWGLPGVAIGTLIPLIAATVFVRFPAACRGAGLSTEQMIRRALWPALWPAVPMALTVIWLRHVFGTAGAAAWLIGACGLLVYVGTFLSFAVPADDRAWYARNVGHLLRPVVATVSMKQ